MKMQIEITCKFCDDCTYKKCQYCGYAGGSSLGKFEFTKEQYNLIRKGLYKLIKEGLNETK